MRVEATPLQIFDVLARVAPGIVTNPLADELHARLRTLTGHWRSTGYGCAMELEWPPPAV